MKYSESTFDTSIPSLAAKVTEFLPHAEDKEGKSEKSEESQNMMMKRLDEQLIEHPCVLLN